MGFNHSKLLHDGAVKEHVLVHSLHHRDTLPPHVPHKASHTEVRTELPVLEEAPDVVNDADGAGPASPGG